MQETVRLKERLEIIKNISRSVGDERYYIDYEEGAIYQFMFGRWFVLFNEDLEMMLGKLG